MKNLLKEELSQIQYLMGYKKGVIISEQTSAEEEIHTKSQYVLDKVETAIKSTGIVNTTNEILSNLLGKTLYLYNKPTTCNTSLIKNMIGGKEATTNDTVLPVPYTIKTVEVNTLDDFIGKSLLEGDNAIEMYLVPDMSVIKDEKLKNELGNFTIENFYLLLFWKKEIGWEIVSSGEIENKLAYNDCLIKALNEMLPDGLAKIKKEKTDLGYVQGDDKDLA